MINSLQEKIVGGILVLLALLFINPFHFWMPNIVTTILVVALIVVFALFASLVIREHPRDEREQYHIYRASRWGYLVALFGMIAGVVYQALFDYVDPVLVIILVATVIVKLWSHYRLNK